MSSKRGGGFNHYENDRHKRTRPNDPLAPTINSTHRPEQTRNSYSARPLLPPQHGPQQKFRNKDNPVLEHIDRLPDPGKCEPCRLAATEMQTGMIALLDKLEGEELTPDGDKDVLIHARELRRLLSARNEKAHSSQTRINTLDDKRPVKDKHIHVPTYIEQKLQLAKELPPLPHITEPHLQEAVFTHISVHGNNRQRGVEDADLTTYERLEFLGDAYIELIASRLIVGRLPHVNVPQQSYLREQLVKNDTLGQFSKAYGLPDRLKHGGHIGDSKAWTKVVADVFEAYVAGVVLSDPEHGFKTAEHWLTALWAPQMLGFKEEVIENPKAKDDLQRLILTKGVQVLYREERNMVHEAGVQKFFMGAYLTGWGFENEWLGSGEGRNKAQAAVYAAMDALSTNSSVLQVASKKKQEMVQQRQEEEEKKRQEADEQGQETDNKPGVGAKVVVSDANLTSDVNFKKGSTWRIDEDLDEKERKDRKKSDKKERREKKEKKRKEASHSGSA